MSDNNYIITVRGTLKKTHIPWEYGPSLNTVALVPEGASMGKKLLSEAVSEAFTAALHPGGWLNGRVACRYYTSDTPKTKEEFDDALIRLYSGALEVEESYGEAYSSWTIMSDPTNVLTIGGHDLVAELHDSIGKFIHLEFEVSPNSSKQ